MILCILKRYILFRSLVGLALLAVLVCYQSVDARERSQEAKDSFKYSHPCPSNGNNHGPCPGYVIDHIKPLTCDGADDPSNMQWQTKAEGKAKDKWERKGARLIVLAAIRILEAAQPDQAVIKPGQRRLLYLFSQRY